MPRPRISRFLPGSVRGLLLFLPAAILLPVLAIQVVIYSAWYQTRRDSELQANLQVARLASMTFLDRVEEIVVHQGAVGRMLEDAAPASASDLLKKLAAQHPRVRSFSWIDGQGKVVASSDPGSGTIGTFVDATPFFQQFRQGQDWAVSDLSAETGGVVIASAMRDDDGRLTGAVTASVGSGELNAMLAQLARPPETLITLFDRQGRLGCVIPTTPVADRDWLADDPLLRQALAGQETKGTFISPIDGAQRFAARVPVGPIGWAAGASRPQSVALAPVMRSLLVAVGLLLGATVVSVLLALGITRRISAPLRRLQDHARAIGAGNLGSRIDIPGVRELSDLAGSFNRMAEDLEAADRRKQRYLDRLGILFHGSAEMLAKTEPADLTRRAAQAAQEVVAASSADCCCVRTDSGFRHRAVVGPAVLPPPAEQHVRAQLLGGRQSVRLGQAGLSAGSPSGPDSQGGNPAGGLLAVPLLDRQGDVDGFLTALAGPQSDFSLEDESLLMQLGAITSLAVQHLRARGELAEHAEELARSNRDLEQFAYVASHDLQEPLRIVTSYVQLLERRYRGRLDGEADKFIAYVVDATGRMKALIGDLLAYSRVGTRGRAFAEVDCGQVVRRALDNLGAAVADHGVQVTVEPLPTVTGDATQLMQLFQNLIGNAIKFREPARRPEVHVGARRDADGWLFHVRDNGIGIEPQYCDRIFQIFQRLHDRGSYPGTGMGLAICKRIVERHGGQIWVDSEPGKGSTFLFTLQDEGMRE